MQQRKFTETNIPTHLKAIVRYDRGGHFVTHCKLIHKESMGIVAIGMAVCSLKEQPCKKIGRAIAIGRALHLYYEGERRITDGKPTTETN
jgi:hypothetical protein